MLDNVIATYLLALPEASQKEATEIVTAAAEAARQKHADFDRFLPGIEFLSTVFFTDHKRMPLTDYLETLYCAVKHADFSKAWRQQLKRPAVAPEQVN
jgi:hypothetical protein